MYYSLYSHFIKTSSAQFATILNSEAEGKLSSKYTLGSDVFWIGGAEADFYEYRDMQKYPNFDEIKTSLNLTKDKNTKSIQPEYSGLLLSPLNLTIHTLRCYSGEICSINAHWDKFKGWWYQIIVRKSDESIPPYIRWDGKSFQSRFSGPFKKQIWYRFFSFRVEFTRLIKVQGFIWSEALNERYFSDTKLFLPNGTPDMIFGLLDV